MLYPIHQINIISTTCFQESLKKTQKHCPSFFELTKIKVPSLARHHYFESFIWYIIIFQSFFNYIDSNERGVDSYKITALAMFAFAYGLAPVTAKIFVGYDEHLMSITERAFRFFSFSFLVCGISIFASSLFTALNNGLISALISGLRTLVFQIAAVFVMPLIWDVDGIWASIVVAEALSAIVSIIFLICKRKTYKYF